MEFLLILFIFLAVLAGLGITFLYLLKNTKINNLVFNGLILLAMIITFLNVTSLPANYVLQRVITLSFGFLALIALFLKIKAPSKGNLANILITASILSSLISLFFF